MNRYFEASGLMNLEPYTQISELSSSRPRIDTDTSISQVAWAFTAQRFDLVTLSIVSDVPSPSCDE